MKTPVTDNPPVEIAISPEPDFRFVSIEIQTGDGEDDGLWQESLTVDEAEQIAKHLMSAAAYQRLRRGRARGGNT